jgi:hypothetical protein
MYVVMYIHIRRKLNVGKVNVKWLLVVMIAIFFDFRQISAKGLAFFLKTMFKNKFCKN